MELLKLKNVKSAKIEANWDLQFKFRIRDFMLNDNRVCGDSIALSEATAVVILRE